MAPHNFYQPTYLYRNQTIFKPYVVFFQCLYWNELPYSEDVRQFTFGSLPLKEGATINKKYEPSSQQLDAVDDLITSMDLTKANE